MPGSIVKSMKLIKLLMLAIALLGSAATSTAWADRGHRVHHGRSGAHVGLYLGLPLTWPYFSAPYDPYYPYGPYYYSPYYRYGMPVQPAQPQVYIEQPQAQEQSPAQNYWYFCSNPKGYYPYVKQCSSSWVQVTPQPPPGN
jgi:hypothetical protein